MGTQRSSSMLDSVVSSSTPTDFQPRSTMGFSEFPLMNRQALTPRPTMWCRYSACRSAPKTGLATGPAGPPLNACVAGRQHLGEGCVLAPGEAAAPGVVLIVCGVSLAVFGVALVTLVLRALLGQAVARDVEAKHLQSELDEVI
jgi:DUF2975 family protein